MIMNDKARKLITSLAIELHRKGKNLKEITEIISKDKRIQNIVSKSNIFYVVKNVIDMYKSLINAIIEAGGNPNFWETKQIKKFTIMDLFSHLATNKIRFAYDFY